jgi:putative DNA primase/helicase
MDGTFPNMDAAKAAAGQAGLPKPVIRVRAGELDTLATKGEEALCASNLPIYQRGDVLVRPISKEVSASRGRTTVAAGLTELSTHAMLDLLSQAASWVRFDKRVKAEVACDPPGAVPAIILSRKGQWKLPPVAGVVTTPTLRPDGSILSEPGYDAATRLYHVADPSLKLGRMPEKPTRADAEQALETLKALLTGFPFVTAVDRAVALSGLITPVVRGALNVVPFHGFRASTAGSGKTYLVDLASAISTGRPCPVVAAGQTEEETEKRLVGLLICGFPIVSIDNINGELGGDLLCQLIERPLIRVRPLGKSEIMELESRATVFGTGNGLRVRGDMTRRSLLGNLDAQMERPELREFNTDPMQEVLSDRGKYVAACLTIVRAYAAAGHPGQLPALASFEDWSDSVRSALVWLGCEDPVISMEAARDDDPDLAELREVLGMWKAHLGSGSGYAFTARDAAKTACKREVSQMGEPTDFTYPEFRDVLLRIAGDRGNVNTRKLGNWLLDHAGRIVGGLRVVKLPGMDRSGVVRWNVQETR